MLGSGEEEEDWVGLPREEVDEEAEVEDVLVVGSGTGRLVEEEGPPAQSFQDLREVMLRPKM